MPQLLFHGDLVVQIVGQAVVRRLAQLSKCPKMEESLVQSYLWLSNARIKTAQKIVLCHSGEPLVTATSLAVEEFTGGSEQ